MGEPTHGLSGINTCRYMAVLQWLLEVMVRIEDSPHHRFGLFAQP